ncbi:hypothetical protein AB5J55_35420 [Streptomyces sp. R11]|uniref:NlpC/P60 domain-containing protein n=1 Tax=Streptomyces sp. R11 TaxID=3238625 RepID=A0AB39N7I7_9ACTN
MAGAGGVLVGRGYVSIRPEFEGDWSNAVNARASRAGKSGAGAFGKAFGAGIKGIGALAGVAIAANLSSAAAGAAVLAPALTTAAAAAGALKLGLSGVGDAFKAAFADTSAQASSAASATRAVESAQRGLANAQRGLADARVQAAERVQEAQRAVADAERDLARTVEESAQRQRDAAQDVRDAERDLRDAQLDAREAQESLTDAREDATRALQDMNTRLSESRLDEREAVLRLKEAETELRAAQANPGVTPDQLAKIQLAYDRAKLNLQEQRTETQRLASDTAKANKAGVEGSELMQQARERAAAAGETVADRERALARAQEEARRTGIEAAQDIADAQRALGEAQQGVDKARADGQRQIEDAQRAVADAAAAVADAQAAAAAQTSQLDQAMAKLSPNAQSFVRAVQGLAPAWKAMRLSVQDSLFQGLDSTVTTLGRTTIPILQRQLTATAGVWNEMAKSAAGAVTEMAKSGMLDKILQGATDNLAVFKDTPKQLVTAWGQLAVAAQPAFNKLLTQFAGAIKSFTDGIAASFESGGLEEAINTAFGILSQFGTLIGNIFGVVSQIFKAASDAGAEIVGTLGAVFGELEKILATPEMQAQLRSLFASVAQIVSAIVPVIGAVVQAVVPLLAAIAAPIAELATALGPVLGVLATTLGAALTPIIQALMPVLVQVGAAIIQIVQAVMPLLQPIAALISAIVTALAPALQPVIALVTNLVRALVGPLTSVVKAISPILTQVAEMITQVFLDLMTAIEPLIPIALQLVEQVFAALQPMLPAVATAFGAIAQAAVALLPPIAQIATQLAQALLPIIADLAPLVAQLGDLFAGLLLQAMPPLTEAVLTLFTALEPLWPLLGELVGQVVGLATGLLAQLLPSFVQLALAFVPIIPSLAEILALVIELAVNVLSHLLPPLVQLAGFLAGILAGALKVAIGWLVKIVGWISTIVAWIADKLGPIFKWVGILITGVIDGIVWVFRRLYDILIGHSILPDIIRFLRGPFAAVFRWIRDNVIRPVMNGISATIKVAWEKGIRPVFNTLKSAIGSVADAFDTARKAIKVAWDRLKKIARDPIQYVVDIVYNKGIVGVWNKIAGAFGADKLKPFKFARGGILPGYTPGRDPHKFYSPTGGALEMSGGEAIMRPEFTRAVGPGFVSYFNRLAKSSGASGVRRQLAPLLGGNPRTGTDHSLRFADGGIFSWVSSAASAVKGAGSAAWNGIKKGAKWLADTLEASARAGVKNVVNPLLRNFPGADTGIGKMIRRIPDKIIDTLFGYSKKADEKGGGGLGGPRIQAALRWAKTQDGLPYQWGGNGRPSWDCSGFMSAIESVIRGQRPHRRWSTHAFHGKTAPPGWVYHGNSPFRVGITAAGVGHTAGTLGKTNVESRGGDGVVVGRRARGYKDRLFTSWYGFQPGKYDAGGFLQPGFNLAYNGTGKPEPVLTGAQFNALAARGGDEPITVEIHTQDRALADFIDVRVHRNQQELMAVINAS